jgi:RimJ/RimL family protein N-acetyltransferase
MKKRNDDAIVFLRGKRLSMRPLTKEDIPLFLRWMNDPEVNQFLAAYLPVNEQDEHDWLEQLHKKKNEEIILGIVDVKTNKLIGSMGIHRINWKDRTATTGAVIGDKRYWGKGYGTEAKMLLLNYAFNTLNLRKICSFAYSYNKRSVAYSKKCGYKVEGAQRQHIFKNGRYWDLINLAVFKRNWQPLWETFRKANNL